MPVVELDWTELEGMVGRDRSTIEERIPMLGADVERIDDESIEVEFFPDRPDLFSIEGVARALRGSLGVETGCPSYDVGDPVKELEVDGSVEGVRPWISGAVVRGMDLGKVASLMGLQERLHMGPGRGRKKVSIGIHELSAVEGDLVYSAADPTRKSFVPLDSPGEMDLEEIAGSHPKGGYASIVAESPRWPVIEDEVGVISFPPVINSLRTEIDASTRDLLLEITGTEREDVDDAMAVVCSALSDRGGALEAVELTGSVERVTPEMEPETWRMDPAYVRDLLGLDISDGAITESLGEMRMTCEAEGRELVVDVPRYRSDVMHRADVAEDVAIGFGYEEVEPEFPDTPGIGGVHGAEVLAEDLRDLMTGLGFLEVMTLTLGNRVRDYLSLRRTVSDERAVLDNPISEEHTQVRTDLLPSLLEILEHNRHRDLPQRVFEYAEVVRNGESRYRLGALSLHEEADFTEARAVVEALSREVASGLEVAESGDPAFLEGRRGSVIRDGEEVGVFGELHPEVLENFGLLHPAAGLELNAPRFTKRRISGEV